MNKSFKIFKKLRCNWNIKDGILKKKHCFKVKKELQLNIKVNQMKAKIFLRLSAFKRQSNRLHFKKYRKRTSSPEG